MQSRYGHSTTVHFVRLLHRFAARIPVLELWLLFHFVSVVFCLEISFKGLEKSATLFRVVLVLVRRNAPNKASLDGINEVLGLQTPPLSSGKLFQAVR